MDRHSSLPVILAHHAELQPVRRCYVFLSDRGAEEASLTFAQLNQRAHAAAARLVSEAQPGDRALLVFRPGLDFLVAFFGCLVAGVIPVPVMVPRRLAARDPIAGIVADCGARLALTSSALATGARKDVAARLASLGLSVRTIDAAAEAVGPPAARLPAIGRNDIAFLQYTSGSTSEPKGVVVSHDNLLHNLDMIRTAFGNSNRSTMVSWLPLFHDMGLVQGALQPLYVGALGVLMTPATFMRHPLVWLRAINDYRADVAGGPNFAYDLCVERFRADLMSGVDLSSWQLAFNGAEPVRSETIARFAETFAPYGFDSAAAYPCYGMAEATLMISGGRRGAGPTTRAHSRQGLRQGRVLDAATDDCQIVVGCGRAVAGERIAIVDPDSARRNPPLAIGEIWIAGPHVARGYWRNAEATASAFGATIAGEGEACWLRTGDLGFCDAAGELFITGRIKDLVIIRGVNHYPQDIEDTVQHCHPALRRNGGAAFGVTDEAGEERLVVVQEVERTQRHRVETAELVDLIREAIAKEHELSARDIVLIRPGSLPKTSSGKVQRSLTRRLWLEHGLEALPSGDQN